MPNFHETSHGSSHSLDSALADAMTWLGRTPLDTQAHATSAPTPSAGLVGH